MSTTDRTPGTGPYGEVREFPLVAPDVANLLFVKAAVTDILSGMDVLRGMAHKVAKVDHIAVTLIPKHRYAPLFVNDHRGKIHAANTGTLDDRPEYNRA